MPLLKLTKLTGPGEIEAARAKLAIDSHSVVVIEVLLSNTLQSVSIWQTCVLNKTDLFLAQVAATLCAHRA
ncbi:hypothetical protein GCM10011297_21130 [Bacterioplanes sanyensis]|nr:hypothetical protein GCM10011297_21130 [Bacterioplanes sanyensis]